VRSGILGLVLACTLLRLPAVAQMQPTPPQLNPPETMNLPHPPSVGKPGPKQSSAPAPPARQPQAKVPTPTAPMRLTLQEAETLALKNNPQISVYHLLALASAQLTREEKAAYYPNIYGSLTAVAANEASRIAAGALNNSIVYERAAGGLTLSQLITDFGRTNNLVATSALRAKAADMNSIATADQIRLAVDLAFYNALQASAEQTVAEQTVAARQAVSDQVTTLFQNKLRSELDVSFADANLAQAKLLLLDAQNSYQAALSQLLQVLGFPKQQSFELLETDTSLNPPPGSVNDLVDQAFRNRPEIMAQDYEYRAAQHFQKAERDLLLPSVEALGVVGKAFFAPTVNGVQPFTSWYGAAGVNVNIPIFNGFLYPARSKQAALRTQATQEQLRDLKDRIANEVRTSWLNAMTAFDRINVTQQFVDQSNLALDLSQARYKIGLSSIVELSQAQLQQTQAQIQLAAAKYQYRIALSVLRFETAAP
jgi:outer membrane protein